MTTRLRANDAEPSAARPSDERPSDERPSDEPDATFTPDPDALLCALVLTPATYSRNRFFALYRDPRFERVRRRAQRLRGLLRQIARADDASVAFEAIDDGYALELVVPSLGFRRRTLLGPLERHLVEYVLGRARGGAPPAARAAVEGALARLAVFGPDPARLG